MKTPIFFLKTAVLLGLILIFSQNVRSQKTDTLDLVSIKVHIVGEGTPQFSKDGDKNYFTMATVTNNQKVTISFWIMTCSWPVDNWVSDNDSIYFRGIGCDANFPVKIELQSNSSIDFYGTLISFNKKDLLNKYVRLGFMYFGDMRDMDDYLAGKMKRGSVKKYWSNRIKLEDTLFKYEIE